MQKDKQNPSPSHDKEWVEREVDGSRFPDARFIILYDTGVFCYKREANSPFGLLRRAYLSNVKKGRSRFHTRRGILMHSSLGVTTAGLPLGLKAIKFWTRKKFKGANALKKKINPTRVRAFHSLLMNGVKVEFSNAKGNRETDYAQLIDFQNPANNDFLVVNQFNVPGTKKPRRSDIVVFVNGLPLAVIELKNRRT